MYLDRSNRTATFSGRRIIEHPATADRDIGIAGSGGGILVSTGGSLTVLNSTIGGNQANRAGGGIETQSGNDLTLGEVSLENNIAGIVPAPGNGGGLSSCLSHLSLSCKYRDQKLLMLTWQLLP